MKGGSSWPTACAGRAVACHAARKVSNGEPPCSLGTPLGKIEGSPLAIHASCPSPSRTSEIVPTGSAKIDHLPPHFEAASAGPPPDQRAASGRSAGHRAIASAGSMRQGRRDGGGKGTREEGVEEGGMGERGVKWTTLPTSTPAIGVFPAAMTIVAAATRAETVGIGALGAAIGINAAALRATPVPTTLVAAATTLIAAHTRPSPTTSGPRSIDSLKLHSTSARHRAPMKTPQLRAV